MQHQNQSKAQQAGSRLSLLTQKGLDMANQGTALESSAASFPNAHSSFLPGSRLNLNPVQRGEFETMYHQASNYARKSYGGNTQTKYQSQGLQPIDPFKKNKTAMKNDRFAKGRNRTTGKN